MYYKPIFVIFELDHLRQFACPSASFFYRDARPVKIDTARKSWNIPTHENLHGKLHKIFQIK